MTTSSKTSQWSKNQAFLEQQILDLENKVKNAANEEKYSHMVLPIYEESYEKFYWLQKQLDEISQEKYEREYLLMKNNNLLNQMKTIQDENRYLHKALNSERQKLKRNRQLKLHCGSPREECDNYCNYHGIQEVPMFSWETTDKGSCIVTQQKSEKSPLKENKTVLPKENKKFAKMEITNSNEVAVWIADEENNFQYIPAEKYNINLQEKGMISSYNKNFYINQIHSSSKSHYGQKNVKNSLQKAEKTFYINLKTDDKTQAHTSDSKSSKTASNNGSNDDGKTNEQKNMANTPNKILHSNLKETLTEKLSNSHKTEISTKKKTNSPEDVTSKHDTCLDNNTSNKFKNKFYHKCVIASTKICNLNQFIGHQTGRFKHYYKILYYLALIMLCILIGTLIPVPWRI
ncbi:uncharacterized protein LOC111638905 [Centruroides sculpturatus]|uniref:uncharacterized protein LOC111638905 n=1 Tax=Centruroides sculpturatus TaxID=218467 RepID=UPI000C6DA35F|nr:uncharacterized protein LOC111638905 [Centruroides sculpturatus]